MPSENYDRGTNVEVRLRKLTSTSLYYRVQPKVGLRNLHQFGSPQSAGLPPTVPQRLQITVHFQIEPLACTFWREDYPRSNYTISSNELSQSLVQWLSKTSWEKIEKIFKNENSQHLKATENLSMERSNRATGLYWKNINVH